MNKENIIRISRKKDEEPKIEASVKATDGKMTEIDIYKKMETMILSGIKEAEEEKIILERLYRDFKWSRKRNSKKSDCGLKETKKLESE